MTKIAGPGSASGSISQRHGSADPYPDPDPHQNVMDPQHWLEVELQQRVKHHAETRQNFATFHLTLTSPHKHVEQTAQKPRK
jgi:hypothetical protein